MIPLTIRYDFRLGDWRDVLSDVSEVSTIITDPPFSARTHAAVGAADPIARSTIPYSHWTESDAIEFVDSWAPRCSGWTVIFNSHDMIPALESALRRHNRYVFAPIAWLNKSPRLLGDGPASWISWILVSRPRSREYSTWGCLPGFYQGPREKMPVVGGKPLWLMRALVRDYSRPGDTVCDPFAGGGTTLMAAHVEGRHAIGSEIDAERYNTAVQRIKIGGRQPLLDI